MAHVGAADVLGPALAPGEDLQLAPRRARQLLERAVRVGYGNLPVLLAVRDQERHADAVEMAFERHFGRLRQEIVHAARAERPEHMRPVVRHRVLAFAANTGLLHFRPIVVRAPDRPAPEARLIGNRARREVAAERYAGHPDAVRVDFRPSFQPVDRGRAPTLAVRIDRQTLEPQGLAAARLVDAQAGNAAPGERFRQARPPEQFLAAVET